MSQKAGRVVTRRKKRAAREYMLAYLEEKPPGKFGAHVYTVDAQRRAERALFRRYQERHGVPDEC